MCNTLRSLYQEYHFSAKAFRELKEKILVTGLNTDCFWGKVAITSPHCPSGSFPRVGFHYFFMGYLGGSSTLSKELQAEFLLVAVAAVRKLQLHKLNMILLDGSRIQTF